ncbi:MAG: response regulator [Bacteroidota bacterium]
MEATITHIQDLITENEIDKALKKLRTIFSISESELVNDVILISGQFKKLKSDKRKGIIDSAEENLRHNRILHSVLSLLDEMKADPEQFAAYTQTQNKLDESVKVRGKEELPYWIKDALFERITYVKEKNVLVKALWVDDNPHYNINETEVLSSFGLVVDTALSSDEALQMLGNEKYDLMLSDMRRGEMPDEGIKFHRSLLTKGIDIPTIFYAAGFDRRLGVPPYAFGMTNMPNELIHLVLDVIERKY